MSLYSEVTWKVYSSYCCMIFLLYAFFKCVIIVFTLIAKITCSKTYCEISTIGNIWLLMKTGYCPEKNGLYNFVVFWKNENINFSDTSFRRLPVLSMHLHIKNVLNSQDQLLRFPNFIIIMYTFFVLWSTSRIFP